MISLADIVKKLSGPDIYPEPTRSVATAQTQMSVVFLTDDYVYKVKKPVNLGYLDYTSLSSRKFYCEQEVKLNRRLCADIYLGVIPITFDGNTIALNGSGDVIEYAVKMRKLPHDRMMDVLLANKQVTPEMIITLAEKVAGFHRKAETSPDITRAGSVDVITINTDENFKQTEKYVGLTITRGQFERIKWYTQHFIKNHAKLLKKRVAEGKIRDCHGDLHAQHICFTDGICIYDCIEFNDRFRYVDVAAEVSFLAMDLDHWEQAELSKKFVSAYVGISRDKELLKLLNFYKCYYAYVRAKVNCFKLNDELLPAEEKQKSWVEAMKYFALAEFYTG